MIGICKVPLKTLISGLNTHENYKVFQPGTKVAVGELEVKMSCIDLNAQKENLWSSWA